MNVISHTLEKIGALRPNVEGDYLNLEVLLEQDKKPYLDVVLGKLAIGLEKIEEQTGRTPDLLIGMPGVAEVLTERMNQAYFNLPQARLVAIKRKGKLANKNFDFLDAESRGLAVASENTVVICGVFRKLKDTKKALELPEIAESALAAMSILDKSSYNLKLGLGVPTVSLARGFETSLQGGEPAIYFTKPKE